MPEITPTVAAAPPLQQRTAAQLSDGLRITTYTGAPPAKDSDPQPPSPAPTWDTLAAARLVQDAADYVAQQSGVKPSLARFYLGDANPKNSGFAGYAQFQSPGKGSPADAAALGAFTLTKSTADDLMTGVHRLKNTPIDQWAAHEQSAFVGAQETILHELGHVTLPDYSPATLKSWDVNWRTNHGMEEALTEIGAQHDLPGFFAQEFGVPLTPEQLSGQQEMSVYRRWTTGTERLFRMAGVPEDRWGSYAKQLGDATYPGSRSGVLAKAIVAQHGGDPEGPNGRLTRIVRGSIQGYVNEIPGSGGKIQAATDALDDLHTGRHVDMTALESEITELQKVARNGWAGRKDDFDPQH